MNRPHDLITLRDHRGTLDDAVAFLCELLDALGVVFAVSTIGAAIALAILIAIGV